MPSAYSIKVRGVVQGVGFRPFVYQLAHANRLAGWVLNGEEGVEIHVEGRERSVEAFLRDLCDRPPAGASISEISVAFEDVTGVAEFTIQESQMRSRPTVRITPDLPVCEECLRELFDPEDCRYRYLTSTAQIAARATAYFERCPTTVRTQR